MSKSREILKEVWGYDAFRPMQEDIVNSVIYGYDTFAILPTGGGKSICFQVPGIAREGLTLVISPLIALMEDQVTNLQKKGIKTGIITSAMSYREIDITLDNARFGKMQFLYTSPERLKSDLFIERCKGMNISLIVVDEAHCISEWGHDFRPAYRDIAQIRLLHPEAPIIALTASATDHVKKDIIEQLELRSPKCFFGNLSRPNISYRATPTPNKLKKIIDYCKEVPNSTGIVYCQTRRSVKEVAKQLRAHGLSAGFYHGGLSPEDRKYMLEHWLSGKLKIMVATNAFGMGIDKPDVRYVLHYEVPNNLEAYYQEAGRAGRDEKSAIAIAFWEEKDIRNMQSQLQMHYPEIDRVKQIYHAVCNFLQIAIGSGNQQSYSFDIQQFHTKFNIPVTETYYALKVLQLNETLHFSENAFDPTRLKFAIGNSALYKFQVSHENVAALITLITRSYPGVFDRFVRIDETEFAKRLKVSKTALRRQLEYLEQYGVADITYHTDLSKITFLSERLPDNYLTIEASIYSKRKKIEEKKLNSVIHYLQSDRCRSQLISEYFNNENTEKCGVCDNCLFEKRANYSQKELFNLIPTRLPASIDQLTHQLSVPEAMIQKAIERLMLEEKIYFHDNVYELNRS